MGVNRATPQVDKMLCTLCGLCVEACPCHAVKLEESGPVFACPQGCMGTHDCCCRCEDICPTGAISFDFEIVLADAESKEEGRG